MSRARRRNQNRGNRSQYPVVERRQYVSVKVVALRLILAALTEDDDTRPARIISGTMALRAHGEGMMHGVLGYLLEHVVSGMTRGYGGTHGAIDALTAELASAVIEAGEGAS